MQPECGINNDPRDIIQTCVGLHHLGVLATWREYLFIALAGAAAQTHRRGQRKLQGFPGRLAKWS